MGLPFMMLVEEKNPRVVPTLRPTVRPTLWGLSVTPYVTLWATIATFRMVNSRAIHRDVRVVCRYFLVLRPQETENEEIVPAESIVPTKAEARTWVGMSHSRSAPVMGISSE